MLRKAELIGLRSISESRGNIDILEIEKEIGFVAKRFFVVSDVPFAEKRGQHAHIEGEQLLIAITGSLKASVFDGLHTQEFQLNSSSKALFMPAMTWGGQWNFSSDAKLLVLCSNTYEPSDYIADIEEFKRLAQQTN